MPMTETTATRPPDHQATSRAGGVKFDATINLGHVLTFMGFLIAAFTAWTTLDKRVTVIEERAQLQAVIDRNRSQLPGGYRA